MVQNYFEETKKNNNTFEKSFSRKTQFESGSKFGEENHFHKDRSLF